MNNNWFLRGYKDAQEGQPYERSPEPEPPDLPTTHMSKDWQGYFEGWSAGVKDKAYQIMKELN